MTSQYIHRPFFRVVKLLKVRSRERRRLVGWHRQPNGQRQARGASRKALQH